MSMLTLMKRKKETIFHSKKSLLNHNEEDGAKFVEVKNLTAFKFLKQQDIFEKENAKLMTSVGVNIYVILTFPIPCISESCIEIKIKLNFYFHISV